ncbi:hypothetical protein [Pseudomonas sp. TH31]|uniref:hypothetical protein n=1 Tax=Pseudomonas sp. TH31 TaxID=2796396 RepID=UPI001913557C|nr:hypothetical protein [Pseudomonas sp. TH31]MBK5416365.1 hypothetical protein [Pseudomonas sp. TH31]
MFSEISDGFDLFKQFAFTGFWSVLLVGGIFCAKKYFSLDGNWPYYVAGAVMVLLLIVPNGWHVVFGTDQRDFVSLLEARQMLPAASLFKADFWGVLIGSGVGLIASLALPARRYW